MISVEKIKYNFKRPLNFAVSFCKANELPIVFGLFATSIAVCATITYDLVNKYSKQLGEGIAPDTVDIPVKNQILWFASVALVGAFFGFCILSIINKCKEKPKAAILLEEHSKSNAVGGIE